MNPDELPRLSDRELEIMQLLWEQERMSARDIAAFFLEKENQYRNTTYTFIKRMLDKGLIERRDPGFICIPLYDRDTLLIHEAKSFLGKLYEGSFKKMFAQFVQHEELGAEEIADLQKLIDASRKGGTGHDSSD